MILTLEFLLITLICCLGIRIISKNKILKETRKTELVIYVLIGVVIGAFIASNLRIM